MGQNRSGPQTHQSWARTSLAQRRKPNQCWASTSLAQHKKSNGRGGIIFPSHPPACRPNVLHAGGNTGNERNAGGRRVYLARRRRCLAGRTASLAVLWWRPVAVSWLTDGDSQQRCYCFKRRRERLLLLPSPLFPFLFFRSSVVSLSLYPLGLFFLISYPVSSFPSSPYVSVPHFLFSLSSPFRFVFSSLRFVLSSLLFLLPSNLPLFYLSQSLPCLWFSPFSFFFGPFPFLFPSFSSLRSLFSLLLPLCWRWASIYRAKGVGLIIVTHGAGQRRSVGQWAPLARRVAPGFSSSRLGVSRLLQGTRLAGINEERGRKLSTFPCCMSGGRRKKNSVAQNDTVLPLFFFYMKRRRFIQNAPFHLNVAPANVFQISP